MENSLIGELDKLDHGEYDSHLITAWKSPNFPWVTTDVSSEETPFKRRDFIDHARVRLQQTLVGLPSLSKQKLTPDRFVLDYVASEMVFHSVNRVHLRQTDTRTVVMAVRNDLRHCIAQRNLMTSYPDSPLWEQGRKIDVPGRLPSYELVLTSKWDIQLLEAIAGGQPGNQYDTQALQSLMETAMPELATLDRTHVQVYEEKFRQAMWRILSPLGSEFHEDARRSMRELALTAWGESQLETGLIGDIIAIEREFEADALQREEHICINLLGDDEGQDPVSITTFLSAYKTLLEKNDKSPADLETLLRWFRGIEYLMVTCIQDGDDHAWQELHNVMTESEKVLGLRWNEYPSIAYAQFAGASFGTHHIDGRPLQPRHLLSYL